MEEMKTPEGKVKDAIKAWLLRQRGCYFFLPVQTGMGTATLDIICCWRGTFVAIEVKSEVGKLTKRQMYISGIIEAAGGKVIVASCLEDVTDRLRNFRS